MLISLLGRSIVVSVALGGISVSVYWWQFRMLRAMFSLGNVLISFRGRQKRLVVSHESKEKSGSVDGGFLCSDRFRCVLEAADRLCKAVHTGRLTWFYSGGASHHHHRIRIHHRLGGSGRYCDHTHHRMTDRRQGSRWQGCLQLSDSQCHAPCQLRGKFKDHTPFESSSSHSESSSLSMYSCQSSSSASSITRTPTLASSRMISTSCISASYGILM